MKKLLITTLIVVGLSTSLFADRIRKNDVNAKASYTVLKRFSKDYPNAKDVKWSINKKFQKADFIKNNIKMTAFYNRQNQFVALKMVIDAKIIPVSTQKEIASQYADCVVNEFFLVQYNTEINPDAEEATYFVDLKNDSKEIVVRISHDAHIHFFARIK
jgi:F0F1-type ATP synthase gamma subunit